MDVRGARELVEKIPYHETLLGACVKYAAVDNLEDIFVKSFWKPLDWTHFICPIITVGYLGLTVTKAAQKASEVVISGLKLLLDTFAVLYGPEKCVALFAAEEGEEEMTPMTKVMVVASFIYIFVKSFDFPKRRFNLPILAQVAHEVFGSIDQTYTIKLISLTCTALAERKETLIHPLPASLYPSFSAWRGGRLLHVVWLGVVASGALKARSEGKGFPSELRIHTIVAASKLLMSG